MPAKPIVLCVDDERSVLQGLELVLGKKYNVRTALSGPQGLALIEGGIQPAVVISDMQMPDMDGAQFLAKTRSAAPSAVRLLLTGAADVEGASRAVNEGRIFLFLRKPCSPEDLTAAVASATEMHRLIDAERVLLQQTLVGCVTAVVNTLGLTNTVALGRATRIRDLARKAAQGLESKDRWRLEFAALLSQLSTAALPKETMEKYYAGRKLDKDERAKLSASMSAVNRILGDIPRLESVTKVLEDLNQLTQGYGATAAQGSRISPDAELLHAIIQLDTLETQGQSAAESLDTLRTRVDLIGSQSLTVLTTMAKEADGDDARNCIVAQLERGMVLAEDLTTNDGVLLLPRGFELSDGALVHIVARFKDDLPTRVKVKDARPGGQSPLKAVAY